MSAELTPELERFVEQEVAKGHFDDRSAVIAHALRLMQRDREEALAGIQDGLDDIANGRYQPLDEAMDELRAEFGISKDA